MFRSGKTLLLAPFFLLAASAAPFTITVNFSGGLTASQQSIFSTAASTWMGLLPSYQPGIAITELAISASGVNIDGVGGILGQAGPVSTTDQAGYRLATGGIMQFDTSDLADMETNNFLLPVILHEMAHVMGFGTLWTNNGVYITDSGQYTGPNALSTYRQEFSQPSATFIPVELGGGAGTANAHWAESVFSTELMTGYLDANTYTSQMTVASFVDIGYMAAASSQVPEPGTFVLISAGLAVIGLARRRRP